MNPDSAKSSAPPSNVQLKLLITHGRANPPFFILHTPSATLGSSPKADVFLREPKVPPAAAMVQQIGDTFLLRNVGAKGSVLLGGHAIEEATLKSGAEIQIGPYKLVAEILTLAGAALRKSFPQANVQVTVDPPARLDPPGANTPKAAAGGSVLTQVILHAGQGGIRRFLQSQILLMMVVLAAGWVFFRHSLFAGVRRAVGIEHPVEEAVADFKKIVNSVFRKGEASPEAVLAAVAVVTAAPSASPALRPLASSPPPVAKPTAASAVEPVPSPVPSVVPFEETLKSHRPDAPCKDFLGFALLGEDQPDPTGGIAEIKKRDALVSGTMEKLRLEIENDVYALLSRDPSVLTQAYQVLSAQEKFCKGVGEESPRCTSLTAARFADLVLLEFGYRSAQSLYASRTPEQAEEYSRLIADPRVSPFVTEKLKEVLRVLGFNEEFEAVRTKTLPWVKDFVSRAAAQRLKDPAEKDWALARIAAVEMDLPACHKIEGLVSRLSSGDAYYSAETGKIVFCPSRIQVNTSQFHLVFKLARLVARAMGPCAWAPRPASWSGELGACFRSQGSIWAALMSARILSARLSPSPRSEQCVDDDSYDAVFADWVATGALAEWATAHHGKATPAELRSGLRNVWRTRSSLQYGEEAVLSPLYRLEGIFAAHPGIRAILGCPKDEPPPRFKHCP